MKMGSRLLNISSITTACKVTAALEKSNLKWSNALEMISKELKMNYLIILMMRKKIMMIMFPKFKNIFQISKNSQSIHLNLKIKNFSMIFKK